MTNLTQRQALNPKRFQLGYSKDSPVPRKVGILKAEATNPVPNPVLDSLESKSTEKPFRAVPTKSFYGPTLEAIDHGGLLLYYDGKVLPKGGVHKLDH